SRDGGRISPTPGTPSRDSHGSARSRRTAWIGSTPSRGIRAPLPDRRASARAATRVMRARHSPYQHLAATGKVLTPGAAAPYLYVDDPIPPHGASCLECLSDRVARGIRRRRQAPLQVGAPRAEDLRGDGRVLLRTAPRGRATVLRVGRRHVPRRRDLSAEPNVRRRLLVRPAPAADAHQ